MTKPFKVLFLYPNTPRLNPPPVSIGTFAALLKADGVDVKVFDTTYHEAADSTSDKTKEENLQVRPFSFDESVLPLTTNDPGEDLRALIEEYQPDLIALSVLEVTWDPGSKLLDAIQDMEIPVLVGGLFAFFAPHLVLRHPAVDMVCVGEGEDALVQVCRVMREGKSPAGVTNLWVRDKNGEIVKGGISQAVDINEIPMPDYSVFHEARLLRPMAGRVYRTVPMETNRGCPYQCTFCNSPTTAKFYRDKKAGKFFRKKTLDRVQEELRYLIKTWDAEYVYFLSDTFLVMTDDEFDRFIETYKEFNLPFWIQSRAETVTKYRAEKLREIGCHRMSIGLEHGSPEFRKEVLKKNFSNEQMIDACQILADAGIPVSVNNIIGFPGETRELVFETIELNRQMPFDTSNAYAFTPFHGTPLHAVCVEKGYIDKDHTVGCLTMDAPLDMPQLSAEEIIGLRKTFALYCKMPKEYWPEIKKAEKDDEEGQQAFDKLRQTFTEMFF